MAKCRCKELFDKNGECDLTYPECRKKMVCYYEEKYHDLLLDAKIAEAEMEEEYDE